MPGRLSKNLYRNEYVMSATPEFDKLFAESDAETQKRVLDCFDAEQRPKRVVTAAEFVAVAR